MRGSVSGGFSGRLLLVFLGRHEHDGKGVTQLEYVIHNHLDVIYARLGEFHVAEEVHIAAKDDEEAEAAAEEEK